ncbi:response regulator [Candidatus Manganitrophus noduliformans]|uniref:Response regulator n=1 Tax=Candidatus Manganitrophus noduliformans TaxID=2606439 RepID=A0A7X6IC55_9BACT|nr:response regulator [Candidatus Manganitrophus noduliformans]NKE72216.1 response regulator [Candidatus Manganitrophus noduliformans]
MPIRILLVEDTPVNMYVLQRVFNKEGFEVLEATDGKEAVRKAEKEKPDIVLMDMRLPGMSGYEAVTLLHKKIPSLPIIAVTADALPGDREWCLNLGCADYFSKPIKYREVIDAVYRIIKDGDNRSTASA